MSKELREDSPIIWEIILGDENLTYDEIVYSHLEVLPDFSGEYYGDDFDTFIMNKCEEIEQKNPGKQVLYSSYINIYDEEGEIVEHDYDYNAEPEEPEYW